MYSQGKNVDRRWLEYASAASPGTSTDVVIPGCLVCPSGCSLVAGQSTLCLSFPDHRSKFDLCDVVGTSQVYPPDLAVLIMHRIAWHVPLNSSNDVQI